MHAILRRICTSECSNFRRSYDPRESRNLYRFTFHGRFYHSENSVYGYRPKIKRYFEVPKEYFEIRSKNSNFYRLVTAYRDVAHKQADINPITIIQPALLPELNPERYGLSLNDKVTFRGILATNTEEGTVREALEFLNDVYSGTVGAEFSYLETEEEREWFAEAVEKYLTEPLGNETRRTIAKEMLKSEAYDRFLGIKFASVKRYGGEGAESMMAFYREFFKLSAEEDLQHIVCSFPHRGRLNVLVNILCVPPEKLFRKLRGMCEFPDDARATGDVLLHAIASVDLEIDRKKIHISVLRNPSHLEIANPVSMGKTRGIMQILKDGAYNDDKNVQWSDKVLNVQVHGDAAFPGQGVNQESLNLSGVPHFEIGGTVHLIINNQLGFTTPADRGRSSRYCSDLAKMIAAPVLHVNADDPEMITRATRVAFKYQRKFRKDVFIDLNCYRKLGHNELDDPTFTNPVIYNIIHNRPSLVEKYVERLSKENVFSQEEAKEIVENYQAWLNEALKAVDNYIPSPAYFQGRWSQMKKADLSVTQWNTGVDIDLLKLVGEKSVRVQDESVIHPNIMKSHIQPRLKKIANNEQVDWATAEAMAIGTLLYQGYNVRISGQDVGRGTFSQRHAMLVNQNTGEIEIPLNTMVEGQTGKLELANSILSEEAVLAYEYGMSITLPSALIIWEAQFGDFVNGAQIVTDTFVASGETKWMLSSGLTILLPHGYDGAGPDHSSCRIERFLQQTDSHEDRPDSDDVNMHISYPTTPAQYFHLLRRQMVRNFRKPLIVVAPKTLLRHPAAKSSLEEMGPQTTFKHIIGDNKVEASNVTKLIFVTGKHFYTLDKHRESIADKNVAIIRLETLCPFPVQELMEEINKYKHARTFVWSQEEPQNMGAWSFVKPRFENLCGRKLKYCGTGPLAASSVGEASLHRRNTEQIVTNPFNTK